MCCGHAGIVLVIASIFLTDHVSESLVPKCPNMWRLLDGQCYRLTAHAIGHTDAANKCKELHESAHLTEISTEGKRKTVSAFLGIINRITEFWVQACASGLVPLGATEPCRVLSNWPPPYNVADFICYGKPCQGGWRKAVCEIVADNTDQCAQNTCHNGATCVDEYQNYRCECKAGYTGRHCETDIDECASNPCMHSGTCVDGENMFTCDCPPGYVGNNCEKDLPTLHLDTNTSDRGERYINVKISSCSTRGTQITGAQLLRYKILVQRYNSSESLIQYGTCDNTNLNISNLEPNRRYRITLQPVFQYNGDSYNGKSVLLAESVKTACEAPDRPVITNFNRTRGINATVSVFWQFSGNHNCDSFKKCVVTARDNGPQNTSQEKAIDCEHRQVTIYLIDSSLQYVIHIRLSNNEGKWTQSMDYIIPAIKEVPSPQQPQSDNLAVIITVPVIIILCCVVGIAVVVFLKRRDVFRRSKDSSPKMDVTDVPMNRIIPEEKPQIIEEMKDDKSVTADLDTDDDAVSDTSETEQLYANFSTQIKTRDIKDGLVQKMVRNGVIEQEYKILPKGLTASCALANSATNQAKNRYKNMRTYDHSRVILKKEDNNNDTDYINASYIPGYQKECGYIAMQGPTEATIKDVWRMVWQEKVVRIVMLTRLIEEGKSKCVEYWPGGAAQEYAGIRVEPISEEILSDYTMRVFKVEKGGISRHVYHFLFTSWQDKSVPKHTISLLDFRRKVNSFATEKEGPVIVHCSAGIGRTGAYIAIDHALEEAHALDHVDVFSFTQQMRKNRVNMIQTKMQYTFVYNSLADAIIAGVNAIQTSEFFKRYQSMVATKELLRQYQVLESLRPVIEEERVKWAKSPEYKEKNRDLAILPERSACVYLSTPVQGCNEYINAVFLSSFSSSDAFLVTQTPMSHTVPDFWRLVYETSATSIVMLSERHQAENYWPSQGKPMSFGCLNIEFFKQSSQDGGIIIQEFLLKNRNKPAESRTVKQFELADWDHKKNLPLNTRGFMRVIDEVSSWNMESGKKPIIIHDMNGCSRCGLLCAVVCVWEKMRVDQEVDVFTIVRQLRLNRPQLIETFEQYQFCHEMVLQYIEAFDTYSNFK